MRSALTQARPGIELEVLVVDDGSTDDTAAIARGAGARVVAIPPHLTTGNPAAARNRGARASTGDPLIFLDADCVPRPGWLDALLEAHDAGAVCVGGSLALPSGLPGTARLDYYCGWYHVHPRRPAGKVRNHPPCNISVRREAFLATSGFTERQPLAYSHEELRWQAELQRRGESIEFRPAAIVDHWNRRGFGNLLRRNYRWAYSSIEGKAETGIVRMAWLYRFPRLLVLASFPLALPQAAYILGCWVRAGILEPLWMSPGILAARLAYAAGMTVGGMRWLRRRGGPAPEVPA